MSQRHESVDLVEDDTVQHVARAVLFAALTAALAYASVPVPGVGVPFSVQPFAVFLAGLLLGPLWGGFSMALYVVVGIAGAPIFSNGGAGFGYFMGPTGGFLIGFVLAGIVVGAIVHRRITPRSLAEVSTDHLLLGLGAGIVVIYAVGFPWWAWAAGITFGEAAAFVVPLFAFDVVKAYLTVLFVRGSDRLLDV